MKGCKASIQTLKGIGPQKAKLLARLGITEIRDFLFHFPRRYEDRTRLYPLNQLPLGETITTKAEIERVEELKPRPGLRIIKAILIDQTGTASAIWFNQIYLKNTLLPGKKLILTGKVSLYKGSLVITVSDYELFSSDCVDYSGRIVPVYPTTEGLSQRFWQEMQKQVIEQHLSTIPEMFSDNVRKKYNLVNVRSALAAIHFPADCQELQEARYRLVFEEIFLLLLVLAVLRQELDSCQTGLAQKKNHPREEEFFNILPFALTTAQKRVIEEIGRDMDSCNPMHRLLQGDVGSGKTVIAAWALLKTCANGYQGILMAPTELLARQHFESISRWLKPLGVRIAMLTGSMTARDKTSVREALVSHSFDIIIGTHALLQEGVVLEKAGLIVIDELHRFGVRQKDLLIRKGKSPDVLVMTATPIPRTLAMTIYGDLDISSLDELPPGRKEVKTYCLKEEAHMKLYLFLAKQLEKGAQVYVVCPLVEESDELDLANAVKTAREMSIRLAPWKTGLIHGKLSTSEKERIMDGFHCGDIRVLVSTTVIEVGVNVPSATVMVIMNAERFGLAQLHQLRGRIGRGKQQSYCILVTPSKKPLALKRLKLLTTTHDGFKLAEEDLRLRGPGEFFGVRQHGLPEFKLANLATDSSVLLQAKELVHEVLQNDPQLQLDQHRTMRLKIKEVLGKFSI